jgi:hypothetical protein
LINNSNIIFNTPAKTSWFFIIVAITFKRLAAYIIFSKTSLFSKSLKLSIICVLNYWESNTYYIYIGSLFYKHKIVRSWRIIFKGSNSKDSWLLSSCKMQVWVWICIWSVMQINLSWCKSRSTLARHPK